MQNNSKTKYENFLIIAALSIPLSAAYALVPVLSSIEAIFPDKQSWMPLLLTVPSLMMMLCSFFVNSLIQKIGIKSVACTGLALILVSGVAPYYANSFELLLGTRFVMGVGLALIANIVAGLPSVLFSAEKERHFATGLYSAFASLGGVLFGLLSGWAATLNWKFVYLVQWLNLLPLLFLLFCMDNNEEKLQKKEGSDKGFFVKQAIFPVVFAFIMVLLNCVYPQNLSVFVKNKALGTTAFSGVLSSLNSAVGFFLGMSFDKTLKYLKQYTLPISLGAICAAFLIMASAKEQAIMLIGSVLFGIGTSWMSPAILTWIYEKIDQTKIFSAMSMYTIAVHSAQFLSPVFINPLAHVIGPDVSVKFRICATLILVMLTVSLFYIRRQKQKPV